MSYVEQIDRQRIPQHVAIIMDGNGRWAQAQGKPRSAGHIQGVETVRNITEVASNMGVKYLTLYTFSTENWNRPAAEVEMLMQLLLDNLDEELFMRNNVRLRVIGDFPRLPQGVQNRVRQTMEMTAANTGMTMVVAISYSSRWEITDMVRRLMAEAAQGQLLPEEVTEERLSAELQTSFMPDPDLLIRTGGEVRISNYLLWQCAYSEFYFCDTYWPEFGEEDFAQAIVTYQSRQRRFGKTGAQVTEESNQ